MRVATTASASKIAGFPWQQTIYLSDSGSTTVGATTASDREMTNLVFAGGSAPDATQSLGFLITLPGATPFSYLNNQSQGDVQIFCNGAQVADLTITKVSA